MTEKDQAVSEMETTFDDEYLRELAWSKYSPIDSPEYEADHSALQETEHVTPLLYQQEEQQLTLIASRHKGPNGEPLGNHDYNPDSIYHADLDQIFDYYLDTTEPQKRIGIVEGSVRLLPDRDESIRVGTESGHLASVALANGMEVISGEPTREQMHKQLSSEGVTPLELAALYTTWSLGGLVRDSGSLDNLGAHLMAKANYAEVPGATIPTPDEREAMTSGQRQAALEKLNLAGAALVPDLNKVLGREWFILENGRPRLNVPDDVAADPAALEKTLADAWWPDRPGRINEVSRLTADLRDKHLLNLVLDQLGEGKSPIVPFGSTHIARLKPCLDTYFGHQPDRLDVARL